jgi:GNAT superfamily N-acetyltransferase
MKHLWKQFQSLDEPYVATQDLEAWSETHYLSDLPDKWQLSSLVLTKGVPVGYRIASGNGKKPRYAHTHRTCVRSDALRLGIGRALLDRTIATAKSLGYAGLTGMRSANNSRSAEFLRATGWHRTRTIANGNELWVLPFSDDKSDG